MVGIFSMVVGASSATWAADEKPHADSARNDTPSFSSASTHSGEPCASDVDDALDSYSELDMINVQGLDANWEAVLRACHEYCSQLEDAPGRPEENDVGDGPLDVDAFVNFRPLLVASQDYARSSGCRFHKASFDAINDDIKELMQSGIEKLDSATLAKLRLIPAILKIFPRIREGETELIEELIRAVDLMMGEANRNGMICTLKANDLWPLTIGGCDVPDALFPTFAKLHETESERVLYSADALHRERRLAFTASFIVEFAEALGLTMSPIADLRQCHLSEFNAQVSEMVARSASKDLPVETSYSAKSLCRTSLSKLADVPAHHCDKSDGCISHYDSLFEESQGERLPTLEEFLRMLASMFIRRYEYVFEEGQVERLPSLEEFLGMPRSVFFTPEEETRMLEDFLAVEQ